MSFVVPDEGSPDDSRLTSKAARGTLIRSVHVGGTWDNSWRRALQLLFNPNVVGDGAFESGARDGGLASMVMRSVSMCDEVRIVSRVPFSRSLCYRRATPLLNIKACSLSQQVKGVIGRLFNP